MPKKIKVIMILICMIFESVLIQSVYATDYGFESGLPDGWSERHYNSYSKSCGKSYTDSNSVTENVLALENDTGNQKAIAMATIATESITATEKFNIHLRMAVNQDVTGITKYLSIKNTDTEVAIFNIDGNVLTVFGASTPIIPNIFFDVDIAINTVDGSVVVWINNEKIFNASSQLENFNFSNFSLGLRNAFTNKKGFSNWYISKLGINNLSEYALSSYPLAEAVFVDASEVTKMNIEFGTLLLPTSFKIENINLKKANINSEDFSNMPFSFAYQNGVLIVTPEGGFLENMKYLLTISNITDFFGEVYPVAKIKFSTAPTGYIAPKVNMKSPKNGDCIPKGYKMLVETEVTNGSLGIDRVELYANGILKETVSSPPYFFSYSSFTDIIELYAVVYDEAGGTVTSEKIVLNTFVNAPPTVNFSGVDEGGVISPEDILIVSAEDTDGTVESLEIFLDNKLIETINGDSKSVTIPENISVGSHIITAKAYDNYGMAGEGILNFITAVTKISYIYKSDFSKFSSTKPCTGAISNFSLVPNNVVGNTTQPHYIINGKADGSRGNCLIMGADGLTTSNSGYVGYPALFGTNKETYTVETDFYLSSKHTESILTMRNDETKDGRVIFLQNVYFKNGSVEYYDGATIHTKPLEIEKWYDVVYFLDMVKGKYSLYLNGELVADKCDFREKITALTHARFEFINRADSPAYVAMSKFNIYTQVAYPYFSYVKYMKNGTEISGSEALNSDTIALYTGSSIDPLSYSIVDFKLTCEGDMLEYNSIEVSEDKNYFAIKPKYPILKSCDYRGEFTYKANGKQYSTYLDFKAPEGEKDVKVASFAIIDNMLEFTVTMKNDTLCVEDAMVILASYKNGIFIDSVVSKGSNTDETKISAKLLYDNSLTYKAFVRDNWGSLQPINHKTYQYNSFVAN